MRSFYSCRLYCPTTLLSLQRNETIHSYVLAIFLSKPTNRPGMRLLLCMCIMRIHPSTSEVPRAEILTISLKKTFFVASTPTSTYLITYAFLSTSAWLLSPLMVTQDRKRLGFWVNHNLPSVSVADHRIWLYADDLCIFLVFLWSL